MTLGQLKPSKILRGPIFPELVQVILTLTMCDAVELTHRAYRGACRIPGLEDRRSKRTGLPGVKSGSIRQRLSASLSLIMAL